MTKTNKIISLIMLAATVAFLALSRSDPNNLLFLFVSPEPVANVARLTLAIGMTLLSFRRIISSRSFRNCVKYAGFSLIIFGFYSMIGIGGLINDYIKLLDVFIMAEAGIVLTTIALTTTVELRSTAMKEASKVKVPALQPSHQTI